MDGKNISDDIGRCKAYIRILNKQISKLSACSTVECTYENHDNQYATTSIRINAPVSAVIDELSRRLNDENIRLSQLSVDFSTWVYDGK